MQSAEQLFENLLRAKLSDCPPCPDDPCVVLAAVDVDGSGTVTRIDNCSCRRMVISFAPVWGRCTSGGITIDNVQGQAEGQAEGQGTGPFTPGTTVGVTVNGQGFSGDSAVSLGADISIEDINVGSAT